MSKFHLRIFLVTFLLFPGVLLAEFMCSTTMTYKWKAKIKDSLEKEEHWTTLHVKGLTEEAAKQTLTNLITNNQREAVLSCKSAHEDLTGCMSQKYITLSPAYAKLGFAAKKNFDNAVKEDCEAQQGSCNGVTTSEVVCKVLEEPKIEDAAASDSKADPKKEKEKEKEGKKK
ncbi:MAG: hypothetical protein SGJ02_10850 [bacterium]|nr:hypothetical protein [bacterium]